MQGGQMQGGQMQGGQMQGGQMQGGQQVITIARKIILEKKKRQT